jgi:hypothetical protein
MLRNTEHNSIKKKAKFHKADCKCASQQQGTRCIPFTYSNKEVTKDTKLFQDREIEIDFRTQNATQDLVCE